MPQETSFGSFCEHVSTICRRYDSTAQAARVARVDRGWLSKVAKGTERPPSLKRLDDMIARWGLSADEAHALRRSAIWEKANPSAKELLSESGLAGGAPGAARLTVLMKARDAAKRLYSEFVPLVGAYSAPDILPSPDYSEGDEAVYLAYGPTPKGSIAVELAAQAQGFARGACLVFGPEGKPHQGLGLLRLDRPTRDIIGVCHVAGRRIEVHADGEIFNVASSGVISFRPFVAVV